ncbi:MAG: response regulator transcription factor [Bacteroidia bacterium]
MKKITVMIVEDDPEFQQWLESEIDSFQGFTYLGCCDSAEDALTQIPIKNPDIVLMDIKLPGKMDGIECLLRLKLVKPQMRFMIITSYGDDERVFEALKAGAEGYILKGDIPGALQRQLEDFCAGGAPMSPEIAKKVISSFHQPPRQVIALEELTERERLILNLLSQGLLYKEIAAKLPNENDASKTISEGTVKVHVHHIYQKLQVNNRAEAMILYLGK